MNFHDLDRYINTEKDLREDLIAVTAALDANVAYEGFNNDLQSSTGGSIMNPLT